jgi:hypothetical protein
MRTTTIEALKAILEPGEVLASIRTLVPTEWGGPEKSPKYHQVWLRRLDDKGDPVQKVVNSLVFDDADADLSREALREVLDMVAVLIAQSEKTSES